MRASWEHMFMDMAIVAASRSRCDRAQVGAVIYSRDKRTLATGYNGPPANMPGALHNMSCISFCERARTGDLAPHYLNCPSIHAEINAFLFVDRVQCEGGGIAVSGPICWECAKVISNSGLSEVHYRARPDVEHREADKGVVLMRECGLWVVEWTG